EETADHSSSTVVTKIKRITKKTKAATDEVDKSALLKCVSCRWKVGAHVSSSGGWKMLQSTLLPLGIANAFALFVKSQCKWVSPPMPETYISDVVLPHGNQFEQPRRVSCILPLIVSITYVRGVCSEKREKSYQCFLDGLKRCEALDLKTYIFQSVCPFLFPSL
ncbi:hypothetical protein BDQ17DRAFT_1251359, partial [Cyathus striatus]